MADTKSTQYDQWIAQNVPADCRRMCREITERMAEAFPELRRVRGHYLEVTGETHPHWWMETPDGMIVDPTVAQFENVGLYEPYTGPEPRGKCLNCGELIWEGESSSYCSHECGDALAREFNADIRGWG